jgi:integrase/recombinase XerD
MSNLRTLLHEYLAVRRALGYKMVKAERLLQHFVQFAEHASSSYITTALALKWATLPASAKTYWWARRLDTVRCFARYCTSHDSRTEVPPCRLIPYKYQRNVPYLFSEENLERLLKAARNLRSKRGLRPHTFETLLGLYAVTGMRTSEALNLDRGDVNLKQGVITIHNSKFGKSRYVAVHPSTQRALRRYAEIRDRLSPNPSSASFFLSDDGTRLQFQNTRDTFVRLCHKIGVRRLGASRGPRITDFRHRLAIDTITRWYRRGMDVERHLPELSTFLGHTHITHTYWYLTATPEILQQALQRVERSRG